MFLFQNFTPINSKNHISQISSIKINQKSTIKSMNDRWYLWDMIFRKYPETWMPMKNTNSLAWNVILNHGSFNTKIASSQSRWLTVESSFHTHLIWSSNYIEISDTIIINFSISQQQVLYTSYQLYMTVTNGRKYSPSMRQKIKMFSISMKGDDTKLGMIWAHTRKTIKIVYIF